MSAFKIQGGVELKGEITPQGAKNEALQIVSASILFGKLKINNCPKILDVVNLLKILELAGAKVEWQKKDNDKLGSDTVVIDNSDLKEEFFTSAEYFAIAKKLRGSIMLMGALLSKYYYAYVLDVGGDKIGARPIDVHIDSFVKLGARLEMVNGLEKIIFDAENKSRDVEMFMEEPSLTGSANAILAAANNVRSVKFSNIACEPYIVQLLDLLESLHLENVGKGSNMLSLDCSNFAYTDSAEHAISPDFVEVGSLISLAMATHSEIRINNCNIKNLTKIIETFESLGATIEIISDDIVIKKKDVYMIKSRRDGGIITVYDQPWPMFSPDLISVAIVAAINAKGVALFRQSMFESRLFFVDNLIKMGAQIILCDPHRVVVTGLNAEKTLNKITTQSPDIRAGVALIIAALSAHGTSMIHNAEEIDRGYENICERLVALGANIERV